MGVFSLWSRLKDNKVDFLETVDLVQIARNYPGRMKILVDADSWMYFMSKNFWKSLEQIYGKNYFRLAGGEYDTLHTYVRSFVDALREVNIELEFFLDGSKGSSENATRQKIETWIQRYNDIQRELEEWFRDFRESPERAADTYSLRHYPCLEEIQNILTLEEAGCKVHQRISGEADSVIAQTMRDDRAAFCVFGNDTDFCVFPDCVFLSSDYFDICNDLGLGLASIRARTPRRLLCRLIKPAAVSRHFGLRDNNALIELSIMGGNDFTGPHLHSNPVFRSTYRGKLEIIAGMIRKYGCAENAPFFGDLISQNHKMREAVEYSRKFYKLTLEDEEAHQTGHMFNVIAEGILQGRFTNSFMAMHRGFHWRSMVVEDLRPGLPPAESVWSKLRSYMYGILLPDSKSVVNEYGRPVQRSEVRKNSVLPGGAAHALDTICENSVDQNLAIFEKIFKHAENKGFFDGQSVFEVLGTRKGFLALLLRYFLLHTVQDNLRLSRQEVYALVALTLANHDHDKYRRIPIIPSARCMTIANWFLSLYRNAHKYLGNLLGVSHKFPAPREVFSGATWVVLYTAASLNDPNPATFEPQPRGVRRQDLDEAYRQVCDIVRAQQGTVDQLVKGLAFYA